MWLSQQRGREAVRRETAAETGVVTLGGDPAGVYLSGERRGLPVYSPGGYQWRPMPGQQVLVMKSGADGESPGVVGVRQETESAPEPGGVRISNSEGSAEIQLTPDGEAKLSSGGAKVPAIRLTPDGEVKLSNGGESAAVHLTADGKTALTGQVTVNGEDLEDLIARILMRLL